MNATFLVWDGATLNLSDSTVKSSVQGDSALFAYGKIPQYIHAQCFPTYRGLLLCFLGINSPTIYSIVCIIVSGSDISRELGHNRKEWGICPISISRVQTHPLGKGIIESDRRKNSLLFKRLP